MRSLGYDAVTLAAVFCMLLSCQTPAVEISDESVSKPAEAPESARPSDMSGVKEQPAAAATTPHATESPRVAKRRGKQTLTCPNGWQEQERMPSFDIDEHARFLKALPELDGQQVLLELRIRALSECRCSWTYPTSWCSLPVDQSAFLTVEPEPSTFGVDHVEFELRNPFSGGCPPEFGSCITGERIGKDQVARFVVQLALESTTDESGEETLRILARVQ